jgi:hypothetical protein
VNDKKTRTQGGISRASLVGRDVQEERKKEERERGKRDRRPREKTKGAWIVVE